MFIDTHCHINMMVKKNFDTLFTLEELHKSDTIVAQAIDCHVTKIINVGTSIVESKNCISLARRHASIWAAIGIHPNDCTPQWRDDIRQLQQLLRSCTNDKNTHDKIVAIGECGLDFHYPDYNVQRQKDAFKAQIELALEYNRALIIHTRDAREETARIMEEFKHDVTRGIVHCFSENLDFAHFAIELGYALGIGATITYPKNEYLRTVVNTVPLTSIVLETDAPFLPPQTLRGKQNSPHYIPYIAKYIAQLRAISVEEVALKTTQRAQEIFSLGA